MKRCPNCGAPGEPICSYCGQRDEQAVQQLALAQLTFHINITGQPKAWFYNRALERPCPPAMPDPGSGDRVLT